MFHPSVLVTYVKKKGATLSFCQLFCMENWELSYNRTNKAGTSLYSRNFTLQKVRLTRSHDDSCHTTQHQPTWEN